jgi:toxoflavin biosynthesis protein ToxD
MTITNRPLRVFLCHSSNDKSIVRELYQKLQTQIWLQPWLDEEELFPGMDWNLEIEKAVEDADAIIVCLSRNSITKEGYVQREIRIALDYADYKPDGTLFIIPVRLEECTPPKRLARWQYADYFEGQRERGMQRLLISLKRRADSLDLKTESTFQKKITEDEIIPQKGILQLHPELFQSVLKRSPFDTSNKLILSNDMEFLHISAGKFWMGSTNEDQEAYDDEFPQHKVDIPYDYWIMRFLLTNELYNEYTKSEGVKHPVSYWVNKKDHPVVFLKWTDAIKYCDWLNRQLKDELPAGLVLRLPTEAEWEKAARGEHGLKWPWGNEFDVHKCNSKEGGKEGTTPVGLYSPQGDSPYGCADMAGNVWEWTHSLKVSYPYKFDDGREDITVSGDRVLRGGAFNVGQKYVRCSHRDDNRNFDRQFWNYENFIGFRVVLSPPISK